MSPYRREPRWTRILGLALGSVVLLAAAGRAGTEVSPKRIEQGDLEYVGAFRVPSDRGEAELATLSYGGAALTHDSGRDSLFISGHNTGFYVAEISIPRPSMSQSIDELERAELLQPWADVKSKVPEFTLPKGGGGQRLGGLLSQGDRLIVTFYTYYDAAGEATHSHAYLDSLDLSSAGGHGLYRPAARAGRVAGYMTEVPPEWRGALGPALTGLGAVPIVTRTSDGPAIWSFDPADLEKRDPFPVKELVSYGVSELADRKSANPLWNGVSTLGGITFPRGTRTILVFGRHGAWDPESSGVCYGSPEHCEDSVGRNKGYHAVGGQYRHQVWAYDAEELLRDGPASGKRPYAYWPLTPPFTTDIKTLGGVAYDPGRAVIYVAVPRAEKVGCCGYLPIILVYRVRP